MGRAYYMLDRRARFIKNVDGDDPIDCLRNYDESLKTLIPEPDLLENNMVLTRVWSKLKPYYEKQKAEIDKVLGNNNQMGVEINNTTNSHSSSSSSISSASAVAGSMQSLLNQGTQVSQESSFQNTVNNVI